jgi:CPA1 family monovalent cation:H+ antiporter
MGELELLLVLFVAAILLAAAARRVGAPYLRLQLKAALASDNNPAAARSAERSADLHLQAVDAARQALLHLRTTDEIGDDAFHAVEEQLDRLEATLGRE